MLTVVGCSILFGIKYHRNENHWKYDEIGGGIEAHSPALGSYKDSSL